jgi:hypothetical protein
MVFIKLSLTRLSSSGHPQGVSTWHRLWNRRRKPLSSALEDHATTSPLAIDMSKPIKRTERFSYQTPTLITKLQESVLHQHHVKKAVT